MEIDESIIDIQKHQILHICEVNIITNRNIITPIYHNNEGTSKNRIEIR